jgi:nucleoside-diphosphate-sugar epimerase
MSRPSLSHRLSGTGAEEFCRSKRRILITGASGWLGLATIDLLKNLLGEHLEGRLVCFGSSAKRLRLIDGTEVQQNPLATLVELPQQSSMLFHYAFLTREKSSRMPLEQYVEANRAMTSFVLRHAGAVGVEEAFVTSSGAVYDKDRVLATDLATNPYGVLKLEQESAFRKWGTEQGRRIAIARVFNLSGPYINKLRSYALSSLLMDALAGGPIRIDADQRVIRSYVSVAQLVSAALGSIYTLGNHAERALWDTAGECEVELGALAHEICATLATPCMVDRPPLRQGLNRYVGNKDDFNAVVTGCNIEPAPLRQQIASTAEYLRALALASAPATS